jgi:hypothetical protein
MNLNLDAIRAILQSCQTRTSSPLDGFDEAQINQHSRMLLEEEFVSGTGSANTDSKGMSRPFYYSIDSLTACGEHLFTLLSDEAVWEQTKLAHEEIGSSWSLSELYSYARSLSSNDRNA